MDIPVKPKLSESRVLFQNQHYAASLMRDGSVIVQNLRRGTGERLVGSSADVWRDAFETALDASESNELCRGFLAY